MGTDIWSRFSLVNKYQFPLEPPRFFHSQLGKLELIEKETRWFQWELIFVHDLVS